MRSLLLPAFVFLVFNVCGQQFVLEGTVHSEKNDEPLPFATLSLGGGVRGTISNANGEFRLVLNDLDRKDSLRVSYVGYYTKFIYLLSVPDGQLKIELREKEERLKEVIVTSLTANQILEKAIDNIPKNYFEKAHISKGFYRMSSRKNGKYVHLSEAAFELYRSRTPKKEDLFRLVTWRGITDEREANGVELGIKPGGVFDFDVVNSNEVSKTFNKNRFLKEHHFVLEGEYTYDDRDVYIISFDQLDGIKDVGLKGKFFIAKDDFAFLEMDYGYSQKSVKYFKFSIAYRALMELFGIDIKVVGQSSRTRYRKIEDKYYLKDASFFIDFHFKSDRSYYNFVLNTKVDYVVTELDLENPAKPKKEDLLSRGKLIEHQNVTYDSLFWKDHTIILPDADFGEISNVILENNEANDTKKEVEGRLKKFPKEPGSRIDSIISFYHDKGLFHGNALVSYKGQTILKKSYPYGKQKLDPESRFRIGSTSKTFTSMLILMLEDEGKLKLFDPISKYIPDYIHGDITIDQLLSHKSGIPNYLSKNENFVDIYANRYALNELIRKFCSDSLAFTPGTQFEYSNSGYVLLAKIAEEAGGKPFGELLDDKIFMPLEMVNTSFGTLPDKPLVAGYYYGQPETNYPIQNVIGSGGIISTAEDLVKWSEALENGSHINKSIVEEAITPRAEYEDWEAEYGYGWMIDKYLFRSSKKHKIVYHPGTDVAFYSMFLKQPDEQITIVLLSNAGDFPRFEISDLILEVLN